MLDKQHNTNQTTPQTEDHSFRDVVESGMFPVVVTCLNTHTVLYINHAAQDFFSVDAEDAIGENATDYWHNAEERTKYIETIRTQGYVRNFETELQVGKKETRHVLLSAKLITFCNQPAVSTIFQDITSQKKAEKELRESEERYHELYNMVRLLTDTMPDLLWAKDVQGRYIFSNRANREKLLKCSSPDTPIGKKHEYFAQRERDRGNRYTFGEVCEDSDAVVLKSQKPGRFREEGYVGEDHLILDVHKAPMFDAGGTLIGTVGAGRDITEEAKQREAKRASDQRYRLLAENVRDVIWTMDNTFHFTYISPSIINLLGYTPEEFTGSSLRNHVTSTSLKAYLNFIRHYKHLLATGGGNDQQKFWELELRKKDGTVVWIDTITSPILDENDQMFGVIGVTRDVTSRIEAQHLLKQAKDDALSASRSKSEFLANMSHEIRTPMNGILGMLQLLKSSSLDEIQSHYVETALQSGTSLLRLLSDILDFSKIEAGKIELSREQFHLRSFLQGVIQSFESLIDRDRILMSLALAGDVPACVEADKFRLQQILVNLLGNAVKFTQKGRIDLHVTSVKNDTHTTTITFTIADTGIGIPESKKKHLFEPFVQVDGSYQRKYMGTGLGLSIVKQLVTLMGGSVTIESRPEYGTTVIFTIEVKDCGKTSGKEEKRDDSGTGTRPASILVVEDEKINAMVISAMLKNMGHTVTLVNNGMQALEMIDKKTFDCILMDIQMPEMDGIETAENIRNRKQAAAGLPPIIAVTAHAMKGDRETFLSSGMDDYITKPVNAEELQKTLAKALGKRG